VPDDPAADVADRLARQDEHVRVIEAVRGLPVRQRDCVTLRYFEEYSIDRIAETLGLSVNSVKTHLRRGMQHLGRALGDGRGAHA
jgi:RNA polymerase sigma factor (sigma-70 family)